MNSLTEIGEPRELDLLEGHGAAVEEPEVNSGGQRNAQSANQQRRPKKSSGRRRTGNTVSYLLLIFRDGSWRGDAFRSG